MVNNCCCCSPTPDDGCTEGGVLLTDFNKGWLQCCIVLVDRVDVLRRAEESVARRDLRTSVGFGARDEIFLVVALLCVVCEFDFCDNNRRCCLFP